MNAIIKNCSYFVLYDHRKILISFENYGVVAI